MLKYTVLTLFPGLVRPWAGEALIQKAIERGLIALEVRDLREYALGRYRQVDDYPYGGGAGMVLRADVVVPAIEAALPADEVILLTPAGEPFTQRVAEELSQKRHLVLVAGRYEGFDARVERFATRELSVGDYVLMGGEVAALSAAGAAARRSFAPSIGAPSSLGPPPSPPRTSSSSPSSTPRRARGARPP